MIRKSIGGPPGSSRSRTMRDRSGTRQKGASRRILVRPNPQQTRPCTVSPCAGVSRCRASNGLTASTPTIRCPKTTRDPRSRCLRTCAGTRTQATLLLLMIDVTLSTGSSRLLKVRIRYAHYVRRGTVTLPPITMAVSYRTCRNPCIRRTSRETPQKKEGSFLLSSGQSVTGRRLPPPACRRACKGSASSTNKGRRRHIHCTQEQRHSLRARTGTITVPSGEPRGKPEAPAGRGGTLQVRDRSRRPLIPNDPDLP